MIEYFERDGKTVIPVPCGYRYISDWTEFSLDLFGKGAYIIDKQIPGCGFTEYCLTNPDHLILPSPRRMLLENKLFQHLGDVYYARNDCEDNLLVDKDITKPSRATAEEQKTPEQVAEEKRLNNEALEKMEKELLEYCQRRSMERKPMKIIVTYDSFKHVKRFLMENGLLPLFRVVVDEFQSIFVDSRFKASTEFEFLEELKKILNPICFLSATPMMDKYLKQLDYFKNLPYYLLDWGMKDPGRVMKPELKVRKTNSITKEIKQIIGNYLSGDYAVLANPMTGALVESKEAVIYVNSVNNILGVIKSMGLTPDQVNILCSDTTFNRKRLKKKLGSKFTIGSVPLKGEPHKMFTFCTRTVYLGADFYSTNARTFILSDANIDSLAVDISLDLPQILGRQRLIENPWKNHAEFYFRNLGGDKEITKQDFDERLVQKTESTDRMIKVYFSQSDMDTRTDLAKKFRNDISYSNYSGDYISINYQNSIPIPVFNNLVYIAEQRAYDIQQVDYRDRFTVFCVLKSEGGIRLDKMSSFIDHLRDTSILLPLRLQELCETEEFTEEEKKIIAQQASEKFDKYYNVLGPERCKAHGYKTSDINSEIQDKLVSKDDIANEFYNNFKVGSKYPKKDAKETVKNIFIKLGLSTAPKASVLEEYFEVKSTKVKLADGSWANGFEILSVKKL